MNRRQKYITGNIIFIIIITIFIIFATSCNLTKEDNRRVNIKSIEKIDSVKEKIIITKSEKEIKKHYKKLTDKFLKDNNLKKEKKYSYLKNEFKIYENGYDINNVRILQSIYPAIKDGKILISTEVDTYTLNDYKNYVEIPMNLEELERTKYDELIKAYKVYLPLLKNYKKSEELGLN